MKGSTKDTEVYFAESKTFVLPACEASGLAKNSDLSKKFAERVKAQPRQCYDSSWKVVERHLTDATYVDGFGVFSSGLIIEHGWVEFDGKIIDPTQPGHPMTYFPGLRYEGQEGLQRAQETPEISSDNCYLPIF